MKKTVSIICIFITFLIIYFLQENFFSWFNIGGIKPNLFVIYILFLGLFLGKTYGVSFGIIFGLLLDFFVGKRIGINAITYGVIGLLRRTSYKKLFKRFKTYNNANYYGSNICI